MPLRSAASLTRTIRGGLAVAAIGLAWMLWPSQDADTLYSPIVTNPAFPRRPRPRVLFDEGHLNTHTSTGRYRPFARLLQRDGFLIVPSEGRVTAAALRGGEIFVSVNPLGYKGLAQHFANLIGLERALRIAPDAFADEEIRQLAAWVADGHSALIVADHAPAGQAAARLSAAFGVGMTNWWVEDRGTAEITFARSNGGIPDHPITRGRGAAEGVESVVTFTGQALNAPPGSVVLLRLSASAREYPHRRSSEAEGRSAAGLGQAVALTFGRGRVVVVGEAAALSAQRAVAAGEAPLLIGMNRSGTDNRQFVLNALHWLAGLLN